ncbi:MAG: hypothetical protein ACOCRN_00005 [Spirochaetia bacterium]
MNHVARGLLRNYDIYERSGFPESMTIPRLDAARQVVSDCIAGDKFIELVKELARISNEGLSGHQYRVQGLNELLRAVEQFGYRYNAETSTFVEDSAIHRTRNWGVLEDGGSYVFTLIRIDVVGSSKLVQQYPDSVIQATFADLREMLREVVEARDGRIWNWEGDGATAAFYGAGTQLTGTLAAISLLHELFFYNALSCPLAEDLRIRAAVHSGRLQYFEKFERMQGHDFGYLVEMESKFTAPQTLSLSETVYTGLTNEVAEWLEPIPCNGARTLYGYRLRFGAE